jgi:hypothetical protein
MTLFKYNPAAQTEQGSLGQFSRNELVSVGTSSVQVANATPRVALAITNSSSGQQVITVNFGFSSAVAGKGVVLQPGQTITDSDQPPYKCFQGVITAIADGAGGQVSVFER